MDNAVSEQEGRYDILENNAGEIMIIIKYREGGPENPRLVYDLVVMRVRSSVGRAFDF